MCETYQIMCVSREYVTDRMACADICAKTAETQFLEVLFCRAGNKRRDWHFPKCTQK